MIKSQDNHEGISTPPEFTIITPVHNGESFIKATIESVLEFAKDFSYEYILVDNSSTDKTPEIIAAFGQKIRVIQEPQLGEGYAVNSGMHSGRGKYVLVVNCDDPLFTQEIFAGVSNLFTTNPNVVVIYSDWRIIDVTGQVLKHVFPRSFSRKSLITELDCLPGPGAFYRLETALAVGGRKPDWKYVSDYEFWLRMSTEGEFMKRSGILAQWRSHDDSITGSSKEYLITKQRNLAAELFVKSNRFKRKFRREAVANIYFQQFMYEYYTNSKFAAKKLLRSCLNGRVLMRLKNLRIVIFAALSILQKKTHAN